MDNKSAIFIAPQRIPPGYTTTYNFSGTAYEARMFSRHLKDIVTNHRGTSCFGLIDNEKSTLCRFDIHRRLRDDSHGLCIIIYFTIDESGLDTIKCTITTNEAYRNNKAPELSNSQLNRAKKFAQSILADCDKRVELKVFESKRLIHWIRMHGSLIIHDQPVSLFNDRVLLLPTRRVGNTDYSAIITSVNGNDNAEADEVAAELNTLTCSILSLISGSHHTTSAKIPGVKILKRWSDPSTRLDHKRLYPSSSRTVRFATEHINNCRLLLEDIAAAFNDMSIAAQKTIKNALHAYASGIEVTTHQTTLSTLAFCASIECLAKRWNKNNKESQIPENLNTRNITINYLCKVLGVSDKSKVKRQHIKDIYNRVYRKQRSAFTHSAVLRHGENSRGTGFIASMPVAKKLVSDLWRHRVDLMNIKDWARSSLLFECYQFGIMPDWLKSQIQIQGILTIPYECRSVVGKRGHEIDLKTKP